MKYLALPIIALLTACSSTNNHRSSYLMGNMLDVAPQSDSELRHPEWGYPSQRLTTGVQGVGALGMTLAESQNQTVSHSTPQPINANTDDLQRFLVNNGIDFEVLPGNHIMVKLKERVTFSTGSSSVRADSAQWLNLIGRYLSTQPDINVVIDGHSDSTGSESFNDGLSVRRANAVKQQLVRNRVNKETIFTRGYGEYVPSCTNSTSSGKACNRRAELLLIVSNQ